MLMFVSACGGGPVAETGSGETAVPQVDLDEQPIADAPDPADRAGASSEYVDCTHGISNGGWSADYGPAGGGASDPEGALQRFLDDGLFSLPRDGYAASGRDAGRLLYTYSVDGVPKVAVIVVDSTAGLDASDHWIVETFATCDPAEYDPSVDDQLSMEVWLDADGARVPTSIITSFQGAEHCGWESVTYLIHEDQQFISDPRGVIDVPYVTPYDDDTELPVDAVDTGYRHDDREFWISADGQVAYLVGSDRVEAWPKPDSREPIWCA